MRRIEESPSKVTKNERVTISQLENGERERERERRENERTNEWMGRVSSRVASG